MAATTNDYLIYGLGVTALIYLVVRPMLRKKKDPLERPMNLGLSQQRQVERDMNNVLVELSQMARQITAQLDTRSAKLEALIEEADRKIEELKRLQKATPAAAANPMVAKRPGVEQKPVAPAAKAVPKVVEEDRHTEVYSLADSGHSAQDIASRLNRPRGGDRVDPGVADALAPPQRDGVWTHFSTRNRAPHRREIPQFGTGPPSAQCRALLSADSS